MSVNTAAPPVREGRLEFSGHGWLWAGAAILFGLVLAFHAVADVVLLAWNDERYSYLLLIPAIGGLLIWLDRGRRWDRFERDWAAGAALVCAALIWIVCFRLSARGERSLSLEMAPVVLLWAGGFGISFGAAALRVFALPLSLFIFLIPPPSWVLHRIEVGLQHASAEVTHWMFLITGIPVYRNGTVFALPGREIEVAEECSGIRSTTWLVICVALAGYLLLRSPWTRLGFTLLALPVGIFKNALRIATLAWLATYVSPEYLSGPLHRYGGTPFTMAALTLLIPAFWVLRRIDRVHLGRR